MIPIDEQIAWANDLVSDLRMPHRLRGMHKAILASLEELKRIRAVQVPEEPKYVEAMRSLGKADPAGYGDLVDYIDALRDLLRLNSYQRDWAMKQMVANFDRAEAAESKLAAMLKLGENPSEEMKKIMVYDFRTIHLFTTLFAKLVEQAGVKK